MTKFSNKIKNPRITAKVFNAGPTGFAPVSPRVEGGILLHKLQGRVHEIRITKKPSFARKPFCDTQITHNLWISRPLILSIHPSKTISICAVNNK